MSLSIIFKRIARAELDDAIDWYEQRSTGRGAAFAAAVRGILKEIADQPGRYAVVYRDVREALVPGYPYAIYYQEKTSQILVLSVFHSARDPAVWQSRV